MKWMRVAGLSFLVVIIFGAGVGGGIAWEKQKNTNSSPNTVLVGADRTADYKLMNQAWNLIQQNYVDQSSVKAQNLTYGAIAGMVDSLGDTGHSTFLTPAEVKQENDAQAGQLQGIGVQVQAKNGAVVVVAPVDGSPAQAAGIHSGDIIVSVDGTAISTAAEAVSLIRGTAGTKVTLVILEADGTERTVTLVRAVINLVNVTWSMLPGTTIAHLRLSSFASTAVGELDTALAAIKAQGATGIIFDLRDNPGGLLDQAVAVASRFIKSGNVMEEKDINGKITTLPVNNKGVTVTNTPMVVLINQGSASAAEIVAGALEDNGRAKTIGETTFGTGTVLTEFPLTDGSALVLAIQEWLTPSGKTIWHTGLTPDTIIALPATVGPLFPDAETRDKMTLDQIKAADPQLVGALSALQSK